MSVGDTIENIATVAAAANLTYQPAAGVEAMLTSFGSNQGNIVGTVRNPDMSIRLTNGVQVAWLTDNISTDINKLLQVVVSNAIYMLINNTAGIAAVISFSGVITK